MSKICYEMLENEFNTYIVSLYEPIDIIPPIYKDNDIDTAVKLSENVKVLRDTMLPIRATHSILQRQRHINSTR